MFVRVVPSIHRPWRDDSGYFSCDYFPETRFTELSAIVEIKSLRDASGRWRSVRGVKELLSEADTCPARAFRCADPMGHEGYLVVGEGLGVIMYGVGDAGMGSPIIWVDDVRDFQPKVAKQLQESINPVDEQPEPDANSPLLSLQAFHEEPQPEPGGGAIIPLHSIHEEPRRGEEPDSPQVPKLPPDHPLA
jgi:hypothetical protein